MRKVVWVGYADVRLADPENLFVLYVNDHQEREREVKDELRQ